MLYTKKIVTIPDMFIDIGVLDVKDYERWRKGQVDYLERVCKGSITKLSNTIKEIYKYAKELNLKIGTTYYRKNGKGNIKLRFSRFRNEHVEKLHSGAMYRASDITNQ